MQLSAIEKVTRSPGSKGRNDGGSDGDGDGDGDGDETYLCSLYAT